MQASHQQQLEIPQLDIVRSYYMMRPLKYGSIISLPSSRNSPNKKNAVSASSVVVFRRKCPFVIPVHSNKPSHSLFISSGSRWSWRPPLIRKSMTYRMPANTSSMEMSLLSCTLKRSCTNQVGQHSLLDRAPMWKILSYI
jgi:hypothetical protein